MSKDRNILAFTIRNEGDVKTRILGVTVADVTHFTANNECNGVEIAPTNSCDVFLHYSGDAAERAVETQLTIANEEGADNQTLRAELL
jgi:hypothetical protein